MPPLAGQKRKVNYDPPGTPAQARKRQKGKDARAISSQTADAALSKSGELNIASFVKAREFEIAALDQSMKKSRKSLTQRAFQQVPRHMRRRTASHNVKKIPKRLRSRAGREMKEDNTPTGRARKKKPTTKMRLRLETVKRIQQLNVNRKSVRQKKREAKRNGNEPDPAKHVSISRVPKIKKNKLAAPPAATSKYKRRQANKTWLPTHLWHTKRAHLTRPTFPLWRMAIPLRPTGKSYRSTHRATGSRGCVAWDTSYYSTIGCLGTEAALDGMLKALGFHDGSFSDAKYRRWKSGSRYSEGWTRKRDDRQKLIAPVMVIWQAQTMPGSADKPTDVMDVDPIPSSSDVTLNRRKTKLDRRMFIRVHPSAFHQLWIESIKVAKMQKPQVLLEDLRFEIGSISVCGPDSTQALAGVLKLATCDTQARHVWSEIAALHNPASLPQSVIIPLEILDPRYSHPPKQQKFIKDDQHMHKINELIVSWPLDRDFPRSRIFDHKERYRLSKALPSQKAVNRSRAKDLPGQDLRPPEKEVPIPAMLLAHRSANNDLATQGSWTLLLPWSCVDLVWRSLMYYSLSSGSTPRFGGLDQTRQVAFEHAVPWFPGDYPGLDAGKAWTRTEDENRFDEWLRRPPSKRFSFNVLDLGLGRKGELGRGWACDWEYLLEDTTEKQLNTKPPVGTTSTSNSTITIQSSLHTQRQRREAAKKAEKETEARARRRNTSSPESDDLPDQVHNDTLYCQMDQDQAAKLLSRSMGGTMPSSPALATARITFLTRGTPKPAARIYRLPLRNCKLNTNPAHPENPETHQSSAKVDGDGIPGSENTRSQPVEFGDLSAEESRNMNQMDLRQRWLALDPKLSMSNPYSSTNLPSYNQKERRNRHGDITEQVAYHSKYTRDLSHIRVFPPHETKPEILNMFGPAPPPRSAADWDKVLKPQPVIEQELWDKHIPCPDAKDLIGFVTTGGYNLAEGRGIAIGSIWVQRIREGWQIEEHQETPGAQKADTTSQATGSMVASSSKSAKIASTNEQAQKVKEVRRQEKQLSRERHLCIVRNAGESIGRLALWELC